MDKGTATAIMRARKAIDDAMPPECFPEPDQPGHTEMTAAKNIAARAWDVAWETMASELRGMSREQVLRAWHSLTNDALFAFETAVGSYGV